MFTCTQKLTVSELINLAHRIKNNQNNGILKKQKPCMVAAKVQGVGISIISDFFKSMIRPNQAAAFRQRPNDS